MEEKKVTLDEIVQSEGWKKFINKMDLYCTVFLVAIFFMIVFDLTDSNYFNLLLTITFITLAITSFFMAYTKFESESEMLSKWFYKIYGLGASIGFITILFIQENWKFPREIFGIAAGLLLIISLILGLREITGENKNKLNWKYFLRLFVALVPLIYLMIIKNI
jgi:hypothetical protein